MDSTQAVERVWRRWAQKHKLNPDVVLEHAHGRRSVETIRLVAPELDAEHENLTVENMEIEDKEGIIAIAGAPELLRTLPQQRCAIVTSATRALAAARLQHAGLVVPPHLISADDVSQGKPSPEPYLKGAALLGFAPADCIVFEDTPAGIESAKAAGMKVIALSTTYPSQELAVANEILSSLANVKAEFKDQMIQITIANL